MASDDQDWKWKMTLAKVPVVYLNFAVDFPPWEVALRRVATGYAMQGAILYTIPDNCVEEMKGRMLKEENVKLALKPEMGEGEEEKKEVKASLAQPPLKAVIDLTEVDPLVPTPLTKDQKIYLKTMGMSAYAEEFFSSSVGFVDIRSWEPESEKRKFFRQEIWNWMVQSLSKGQYAHLVEDILTIGDISALYKAVSASANKPSWISHALEIKKFFLLTPGSDIFAYHALMVQHMKHLKRQGAALGLDTVIPPWIEQGMLLTAAWSNPRFRKIAEDFTMDDKEVSAAQLLKELQKQQLLTSHLNQSASRSSQNRSERSDTRVRVASTPSPPRYCFAFQRGPCPRGTECPYLHEKEPGKENPPRPSVKNKPVVRMSRDSVPKKNSTKKKKPGPPRPPSILKGRQAPAGPLRRSCLKCGASHLSSECKFEGTCDYCKKVGHKQSVCKKKMFDEKLAHVVVVDEEEEEVAVRMVCVDTPVLSPVFP